MSANEHILPANYPGQRIADLRTAHKMTREELAKRVGISPSAQGRIESGETESPKGDLVKRYADAFGVSADFLLCLTDFPGKKNYEIGELGLSIKSAEVLYTRKVDTDVVNRLLEDKGFPQLTRSIHNYFQINSKEGVKVRHELIRQFDNMTKIMVPPGDRAQIRSEYVSSDTDPAEVDKFKIHNGFMKMLERMNYSIGESIPTSPLASQELITALFEKVTGGMPVTDLQTAKENASPGALVSKTLEYLTSCVPLTEEQNALMQEHFEAIMQIMKEASEEL